MWGKNIFSKWNNMQSTVKLWLHSKPSTCMYLAIRMSEERCLQVWRALWCPSNGLCRTWADWEEKETPDHRYGSAVDHRTEFYWWCSSWLCLVYIQYYITVQALTLTRAGILEPANVGGMVSLWLILGYGGLLKFSIEYFITHTQPFYGSMDFVRDNPGEPVPEETFTHSHLSWSSIVPYLLHPSNTIHGILPVQSIEYFTTKK